MSSASSSAAATARSRRRRIARLNASSTCHETAISSFTESQPLPHPIPTLPHLTPCLAFSTEEPRSLRRVACTLEDARIIFGKPFIAVAQLRSLLSPFSLPPGRFNKTKSESNAAARKPWETHSYHRRRS
ncbi:unnamed protein product, partial [Phaeothamnion confervicola]